MFCALSLVVQLVWLGSFDRISVALNECAADIDALNSTRPVINGSKTNDKKKRLVGECQLVLHFQVGTHKFQA